MHRLRRLQSGLSYTVGRHPRRIQHSPTAELQGATERAFAVFLQFCNIVCMKATLTLSGRGLIALPAKMREAAGLRPQDNLIAETTPEGILLRPAVTVPIEIYSDKRIAEFDEAEAELAAWLQKNPPLAS
jgi:antitoxin PrlF